MADGSIHEVSPAAEALFSAWLECGSGEPSLQSDTAALVRYLSGALGREESLRVERAAVGDPVLRQKLLQTQRELAAAQALPWGHLAESVEDPVKTSWLEVVRGRIAAAGSASGAWAAGFKGLRTRAAEGAASAQTALAGLAGAVEQMQLALAAAPAAATRSGPGSTVHFSIEGVEGDLVFAEVRADGELHVRGTLQTSGAEELDLYLDAGGEHWFQGRAEVQGSGCEWSVPHFSEAFRVQPGPVPLRWFTVRSAGAPRAASHRTVFWASAAGGSARLRPQPLEIVGPVRWEEGTCRLTLGAELDVRRQFEGWLLVAELLVGPSSRQLLGTQPLAPWGEGGCEVRIPCPGAPDQVLPFASMLRLTLAPPTRP